MITVRDLQKHYQVHDKEPGFIGSLRSFIHRKTRTVRAVEGVSFHIATGEMVGFLGPNGAGKTTTLKMLSGLLHPTNGHADIAGFTPRERHSDFLKMITLVMGQKQQLIWDLPALDSFRVNQAIYEIPDDEYRQTMHEFNEILELDGILKKQVRKLSLGERMKCELAAALLHRPKILFLDEPTIGLDVNMQVRIRGFVAEYNRRFNATIILTSHYMADVTALCQRIIVIDKGQIVFDGNLSLLIEQIAPSKIIRIELAHPITDAQLRYFGEIHTHDGLRAELRVPRATTSTIAAQLLTELPIADVTIEDPPIEEVIGQVFARHHTETTPVLEPIEVVPS
ncbi:MAG: ATP-binding cassette domain-containing protein [Chloroflexi bacterium AL-W]|nr:ATP-binding cassette domain-containing protein [Chloroflexi bacterium AL-N1]NOK66906.1 ATP-binding cassette domain-containing protein [Chloroflexi bacterium AL-N10]NOK74802.1 ATP-binding cassette domain-containing protein [Chloroflexi bacterium AL-N5]NOK81508.1 ATP-binding cassette domain-containing protein [Chloroflexi bacterium AL-W]NOK88978.1 ATP-binding cassette domain-containing protein [Chloroflexi bacterium AL-N15]